jgi:hypothetical protein
MMKMNKMKDNVEESAKLNATLTKLFTCIENKLPEKMGFCHGRNIPSMADIVCYNVIASPMPGAMAVGFDCKPYPKMMRMVKAVKMCMMMRMMMKKRMSALKLTDKPVMNYFNLDGRAHPGRVAMKLAGMDFDDKFTPDHFDHTKLKGDMNSWVWKQGWGSLPILQRGDWSLAQSHAINMYINDIALGGSMLTSEQRATDLMYVCTWTDQL